jgi:hypothetical protein
MTEKKQATKLDLDGPSEIFKTGTKKEPVINHTKHKSSLMSEQQSPSKFTNRSYKQ